MDFTFVDATKAGAFARIAIIGPPNSGKTWTALTMARVLGANPGLIDTEKRSAAKYAPPFKFKHLPLFRYDPRDLTAATAAATEQGIDPLIVDSWSHFWMGTGGMLEQVDRVTDSSRSKNSFGTGWKEMAPVEQGMLDALTGYPGHVICTLRTSVEYVLEPNRHSGKVEPRAVGLKPQQRNGIEYEFDFVFVMDRATLTVVKSRCQELPDGHVIEKPGAELAETILAWLSEDATGEPFDPRPIRDWILDPSRTVDEIRNRYHELKEAGHLGAAIVGRDDKPTTLGALIVARGFELAPIQPAKPELAAEPERQVAA